MNTILYERFYSGNCKTITFEKIHTKYTKYNSYKI